MAKQGILTEALKDAKALKRAALKNAENSLSGHFREALEQIVSAQLNEGYDGDGEEMTESDLGNADGMDCLEEEYDFGEGDGDADDFGGEGDFDEDDLGGELDMGDDAGLEGLDEAFDEAEDEDDEDLDEALSFTEADLSNIVSQILDEVDHGALGDPDDVTEDQHDSGLLDLDMKAERGWEEKDAPAKKDWTVKEARKLKQKLAQALAENATLKKANKALKEAVEETNLFNRKMFYAHKLLGKQGLKESVKVKIVQKLDEAKTQREAKSIYESIEMALGLVSESKRTKKKGASTLSEALGHQRTERGISQVRSDHLLTENKKFGSKRLQQLAGIIDLDE